MGILDVVLGAGNTQLVTQLANKFGIDESDIQGVLSQLIPAVSKGIKGNATSSEGLGGLVNTLSQGGHQRYLDNPEALTDPSAIEDGNAILGHVFASKDVSRNVASHTAEVTGVDNSVVKQLLPLVASVVMGALSKETVNSPALGGVGNLDISSLLGGNGSSQATQLISSFLDADNDGDVTDDLLNLAKKFF